MNDDWTEDHVEYLVGEIRTKIQGGQKRDAIIAGFKANPFSPIPQGAIDEAVKRHRTAIGGIEEYEPVESLNAKEHATGQWYEGPDFPAASYWPTLKEVLTEKLGPAIEGVDAASSKVVASLRPPGEEEFDTRGLVLGYVQSGKTTNFVSVIAKAADVGYRLIIVLAGLTDNLREQTQNRLEEQLLSKTKNWHRLTFPDADFGSDQRSTIENAATILGNTDSRVIAVVKKNGSILRKLNRFINSAKSVAADCPILIIDDEADQASINVSPQKKNEISTINAQIRELLRKRKTAYIAYTATPFANILVNPNDEEDIYPKDFIHVLPKPVGYFGSETIFGRDPLYGDETEVDDGYDMVRTIPEEEEDHLRPPSGKDSIYSWEPEMPASLEQSINWFVLASAARRARGQHNSHSSMLVHTAMRTVAHQATEELVNRYLRALRIKEANGELNEVLSAQWERESALVPPESFEHDFIPYTVLAPFVQRVLAEVEVIVDNGYSDKRLEYPDDESVTVITIGGNTLARGLTLEGLISSYFVRSATAYDTLLQMGRWFGFRGGYQDLPRIWLTEELHEWFRDLALVEADLRQDLSLYARDGVTPMQFQARIRTHPSMEVTSRAKQQKTRTAQMSFSGDKLQTILFKHKDENWLNTNIEATRELGTRLSMLSKPIYRETNGTVVFKGIPKSVVEEFLTNYQFHESSQMGTENSSRLLDYVRREHKTDSISEWNVSFYGRSETARDQLSDRIDLNIGKPLKLVTRSQMLSSTASTANIKTLVGSMDRLNDALLDRDQLKSIETEFEDKSFDRSSSREAIIVEKHAELVGSDVGHLTIYAIDKNSETTQPKDYIRKTGKLAGKEISSRNRRKNLNAAAHLIGVGIFFPESSNPDSGVDYISAVEPDDETMRRYLEQEEEIQQISRESETDK